MRIFTELAAGADPDDSRQREISDQVRSNLAEAGATLLIASAKGGCGKSVIAANVAGSLALRGKKVAIIDADLNAPSIIGMLGMRQPRGLPLVEGVQPATGPLGLRVISSDLLPAGEPPPISFVDTDGPDVSQQRSLLPTEIKQSDAFLQMLAYSRIGAVDYVIIDLAPGIEDLHAIARLVAPSAIVIVSHSSNQAVKATQQAVRISRRISAPVMGLIENMAGFNCDGCRSVRPLMPEGNLAGAASDLDLQVIGRLPFDPRLAEASDRGKLFVQEFADTPLAKSLTEIATRIDRLVLAHRKESQPQA